MIVLHISDEPVSRREKIGHRRLIDVRKKQKERIALEIISQYRGELLDEPLFVQYDFYLKIPEAIPKYRKTLMELGHERPIKRPDCSNLIKLIEDVMTGIIYVDDCLIVSGQFHKYWSHHPHSTITIKALSEV